MSKSYEVIFENNQQWLETKKQQHPEYFTELADGQNPDFLYIPPLEVLKESGKHIGGPAIMMGLVFLIKNWLMSLMISKIVNAMTQKTITKHNITGR